jgi:hypothetical protein
MELSHSISITVPSTIGLDEPVDNEAIAYSVAEKLARLFGGSRIVEGIKGFYIADNGQQVVESNKDIIAYCSTLTDDEVEQVIKIALDLKTEMKQETILYRIDNIAYIE